MSVWPAKIQQLFEGRANSDYESGRLEHAWRMLLTHLFPLPEFDIERQNYYVPPTLESSGNFFRFRLDQYTSPDALPTPVLVIQFEGNSGLVSSRYRRGQVDHEVRKGMDEMRSECSGEWGTADRPRGACPHPVIHGLAVFGRHVAFYTKTGDDPIVPPRPPFDPVADLTPEAMWLDVVGKEGSERLTEIAEQIKTACKNSA
ncbi:hypothetical protein B0H13DRAFT_2436070 [Mycena leptocephala]|nr:hypothetical protein B0H13DRAFT_2436070 [Mycena leptocephala]